VSDIQMGWVVSGVGLTITFMALGIFIGVIVLLQKLFPPDVKDEVNIALPEETILVNTENSDELMVAALAAAVYIKSRRSGQLGSALLVGPGPYRTSRS
jgi:Na+-transporting methylmalonyl-CoA/oxaloacetate decarboxylase gamma subunit